MATKTFTITNANVSKTFEFRIKKGEMLSFQIGASAPTSTVKNKTA